MVTLNTHDHVPRNGQHFLRVRLTSLIHRFEVFFVERIEISFPGHLELAAVQDTEKKAGYTSKGYTYIPARTVGVGISEYHVW